MPIAKPDIVILDRESRRKCSIYPLNYRKDLRFIHSSAIQQDFSDYLLLHVDGEPLSEKDGGFPLLLLDASWKWASKIAQRPEIAQLSKRSLHGFTTAYPRVSKLYSMPGNGLASVEALYIARLIQGREDISLLDHYYWRETFLNANREPIEHRRHAMDKD